MNPAVQPSRPHLVIRASAGSGKTFQLTNRFIGLLNDDEPVDQILATTFTRKAAGEILARIMERLAKAATDKDERSELGEFIHDKTLTKKRCLELLRRVTRKLHRLRVSTLDSFFAQIASSFSLELGLPPGWQIVDEMIDERLRAQAIESVLNSESSAEVIRLVNLLAKGDAERNVSDLIRDTVDNLYALFQDTQPEAWHHIPRSKPLSDVKLAEALAGLLQAPLPDDKNFTKARESDYQKADQGDWEGLIGGGLAKKVVAGEDTYRSKQIPAEAVAAYDVLIKHARAELLGQMANQTEATFELLEKFDTEYGRLKFEHSALRFDDVTRRLGDVSELGGIDRLAFRMDARISHLLLDEFQDTSIAQWQALRPFAERITSDGQHDGSFFCVGDTKQAIYAWRGGVAELFDALGGELKGLHEEHLEKSFRSAPPVIDAVNLIFTRLEEHNNLGDLQRPIRRWCERFIEHETAKTKLSGYVALETAPLAGEGQKQAYTTLRFAAERIAQIVEKAPDKTVGVLVRHNKTVARLIYELHQRHVPASEEGGNPLTDSAAVQLILSLLRLADHPGNTVARFHLANSRLGKFLNIASTTTDEEAAKVARSLRVRLLSDGYGAAIRRWAEELVPDCSRREVSRLKQLIRLAYQYQPSATLRPSDFIESVERTKIADPAATSVRVMTIHQAKGLQFDTVVLPDFDGGLRGQADACVVGREDPTGPVTTVCLHRNAAIQRLLPESLQKMFEHAKEDDDIEMLCVLYVAVTRAIHAIHIVIAPSKSNERKLHKTYAGLVRAALVGKEPAPENTILYEHGDPLWHLPTGTAMEDASAADVEIDDRPLAIELAPLAAGRRRGLNSTSPSQLEGGTTVKLNELFRPQRAAALNRGTIVHAWFEHIQWLDDGVPEDVALRQIAMGLDSSGVDRDELISQFRDMLGCQNIADCLKRSAYQPPRDLALGADIVAELAAGPLELEVLCEQPIVATQDGTLMTGFVDRLVLMRRGGTLVAADVIDFKTDGIATDDKEAIKAKIEFYRPQIDAYRRAVASMYRVDPKRIGGRLLFVSAGFVGNL